MNVAWRAFSVLAISIAVLFAIRDALGFSSVSAVSSLPYAFHDHLWGGVRLLMLFVAGTVAWWGAQRGQARILASALIGLSLNNNWWFYSLDDRLLWPSVALNYLGIGFGLSQLLRFAATYGDGDWMNVRRLSNRIAPYIGAFVAIFGTLWWVSALVVESPQVSFNHLFWAGWDAVNILVIVSSVIAALKASASDRTRILWVVGSFLIAALGTACHGIDRALQGDTTWANDLDSAAQAAMALGLGYAVLWQRALDIDFVLSRIAVLSLLGGLIAIILAVAQGLTENYVKSLKIGYPGLVANALELGMTSAVVASYKNIEQFADNLIARWRGSREPPADAGEDGRDAVLLDFAREILACRDSQAIVSRLLQMLEVFGGVRAAAVYWRNSGGFACLASHFSGAPTSVSADDTDVVGLERAKSPYNVTGKHRLPASLGFPMVAFGGFQGFVLCDTASVAVGSKRTDAVQVAVSGAASALAATANA
jgi:hypothetical protein